MTQRNPRLKYSGGTAPTQGVIPTGGEVNVMPYRSFTPSPAGAVTAATAPQGGGGESRYVSQVQAMPSGVPDYNLLTFLPHMLGAALGGGQTTGEEVDPVTGRLKGTPSVVHPLIDRLLYGGAGSERVAALKDRNAQLIAAQHDMDMQTQAMKDKMAAGLATQKDYDEFNARLQILKENGILPKDTTSEDLLKASTAQGLTGKIAEEGRIQQAEATPGRQEALNRSAVAQAGMGETEARQASVIGAGPGETNMFWNPLTHKFEGTVSGGGNIAEMSLEKGYNAMGMPTESQYSRSGYKPGSVSMVNTMPVSPGIADAATKGLLSMPGIDLGGGGGAPAYTPGNNIFTGQPSVTPAVGGGGVVTPPPDKSSVEPLPTGLGNQLLNTAKGMGSTVAYPFEGIANWLTGVKQY